MGMFFAGSLACALAPSFALLLAGRIIQACGAGVLMTLLQTVLFRVYPPERRGQAMSMFGMVIAFAPALGPTISGLLVEWLSWRWMLALLVAIAGGVIAAACFTVHNVGEPTHPHIDVLSVVLSTFGFGGALRLLHCRRKRLGQHGRAGISSHWRNRPDTVHLAPDAAGTANA